VNSSTIAAVFAITLAVYLLATDWINLAPWNNVEDLPRRQKLLISVANYTPLLFIAFAVLQQSLVLVILAAVVAAVDLTMHVSYWWLPYLRGASEDQNAEHARLFGGTTSFLPRIGDHPIPNGQHVVVGVLMVAMFVATAASLITVLGTGAAA
jgi:polyferredoxin